MQVRLTCNPKNVVICPKVPEEVKQEKNPYLKKGEVAKQVEWQRFDDLINSRSYFGSLVSLENANSYSDPFNALSGGSLRGVRGPIDKFVVDLENGKECDQEDPKARNPITTKKAWNWVCSYIGGFFFENGIVFNVATSPSFSNMCRLINSYG